MYLFKNFRIKVKLLISFGITIIFSIVLAVAGIMTIKSVSGNYVYLQRGPSESLTHLAAIKTEFTTMRYRVANFVMNSGDLDFINNTALPQYNTAREALLNHLNEFIRLNNEDAVQTTQIKKTNNDNAQQLWTYLDEYEQFSNKVLDLSRANEMKAADDALKEAIPLTSSIDELLESIITPTEDYVAELNVSTDKSENFAVIFLMVLAVVLVVSSIVLALSIGNSISKSLVRLRKAAKEIAAGNLNLNLSSNTKDEIGDLTRDLGIVTDTINELIRSMDMMAKDQENGDIDAKIDVSRFQGSYQAVAEGINNMMGVTINQIMTFLNCVTEFGEGNFNADIPPQPGKKVLMNQTIDSIRDNLKSVSAEISSLIDVAVQGNLSKRADAEHYKGDWAGILNALNELMQAITGPIYEISEVMAQVSQGNFDKKMDGGYQGDFLMIKDSVNNTITNIASYIDEISEVLGSLSRDDLDQSIDREYVGKFSDIKDAINNIINKFNQVVSEIAAAADQVLAGSKQIAESSMKLATGSTQQASAVEELNATILTINESTSQNAENADAVKGLSDSSKDNAIKGNQDMDNMLASMDSIKDSSNSISKIIKTIEDIAFQTNLLALNAAVEAARAGTHGKGFAVVAEEVRNLAGRSQNAAKETAELIEESITRVNEGTEIASTTADALRTIVDDVTKVDNFIASIAEASNKQAAAISQVTIGLSQITEVVQNNSATSEESASASQQLSSQVEMLQNLVSTFNIKKRYL